MKLRFAVLFCIAGVASLAVACGGDDDGGGSKAAGCSPVETVLVPPAAEFHSKRTSFAASDYPTTPPAGGLHSNDLLDTKQRDPVASRPQLGDAVHELEHGFPIVWTNKLPADDAGQLKRTLAGLIAPDFQKPGTKYTNLYIVENADMDVPLALSAWGYLQKCKSYDQAAVRSFIEKYYGQGPEGENVACGSGTLREAPQVPACRRLKGDGPDSPPGQRRAPGDVVSRYRAAISTYNRGLRSYLRRIKADIRAGDLTSGKSTAAQFRTVVFNFDAALRKLKIDPAHQEAMNTTLDANAVLIRDLDALAASRSAADFDRIRPRVDNGIDKAANASDNIRRAFGL